MTDVNLWAILLSAVASIIIGSIWYGPLFGKLFMRAMGMDTWTPEKRAEMTKNMRVTYFMQFLASLVMFFVQAWLMNGLDKVSVSGGLEVALWLWIGFAVPVTFGNSIWGGKMTMFWLGAGNMLLTLLVSGVILGALK